MADDMECEENGCDRTASFELHIPWAENRFVCAAHARGMTHQEGVVADALENAEEELP